MRVIRSQCVTLSVAWALECLFPVPILCLCDSTYCSPFLVHPQSSQCINLTASSLNVLPFITLSLFIQHTPILLLLVHTATLGLDTVTTLPVTMGDNTEDTKEVTLNILPKGHHQGSTRSFGSGSLR